MSLNKELHSPSDANTVALTTFSFRKPLSLRMLEGLRTLWRALTSNRKVAIGTAIVMLFMLLAIFGPLLAPYNPTQISQAGSLGPSAHHLLGTTTTGQDIFSQLLYGTRSSILWSFATGLVVTFLSVLVGLVGGYFGGMVDDTLSLLTNIFLVLPALPLAIVLAAYFPRGPLTIALVITFTSWSWQARVLRSQTLSMRNREFVIAARTCGERAGRIIFAEIFPNEIGLVAAGFVSTTIFVILTWAALEFLGLGDPNAVSWGSILYWAQQADSIFSGAWWWFVPPGFCIALLGMALALINFGIDEIADPRLRS